LTIVQDTAERVISPAVAPPDQTALGLVCSDLGRKSDCILDRLLGGSHWKGKALAVILLVTLFRAFPSYDALRWPYVESTWRHVQPLLEHPLVDPGKLSFAEEDARLANLRFRRTVPVLAYLLNLRRNGLLVTFAIAGVVLLLGTLYAVEQVTCSRKTAFFVCLAVACAWPGEAAFHDLRGGYFDAVALCLLVLALTASSSALAALCVFLAAWTDERALLASAFVLLFAISRSPITGWRSLIGGKPAGVMIAWAAYLATRAWLTSLDSLVTTSGGVGLTAFVQQLNAVPLGIWTGLGGCWILIGCGAASCFLQRRHRMTVCFIGAMALLVALAAAITDITRTMSYGLPAVFLALSLLARVEPGRRIEKLALLSAAISFAVPTYYVQGSSGFWWIYPLPVHLLRWFFPVG
jgi:hypothetical protein